MAEVVPAPYPTADSKLVRIPEGISAGDRFKFAWDGSSISVKCPEGKGAGDEMKVDAPTADHRSLINGLASKAIHDLTKPTTEKRQKLEHMTAEAAAVRGECDEELVEIEEAAPRLVRFRKGEALLLGGVCGRLRDELHVELYAEHGTRKIRLGRAAGLARRAE